MYLTAQRNLAEGKRYTDTAGWSALHPTAYHNISRSDAMPAEGLNSEAPKRSYVNIRFRLRGKRKAYCFLNQLAGANRYLWNAALAQCKKDYEETGKSKNTQFDLFKWYKQHKDTDAPWLNEYPSVLTRTGLKDLSDAYKAFFKKSDRGHPKFKKKGKAKKTFAVEVHKSMFKVNGYFRLKKGLFVKMMDYGRVN